MPTIDFMALGAVPAANESLDRNNVGFTVNGPQGPVVVGMETLRELVLGQSEMDALYLDAGAAETLDLSQARFFELKLEQASTTLSFDTSGLTRGKDAYLALRQGTGNNEVVWNESGYSLIRSELPALQTGVGDVDLIRVRFLKRSSGALVEAGDVGSLIVLTYLGHGPHL